jgi:hypothetical protein
MPNYESPAERDSRLARECLDVTGIFPSGDQRDALLQMEQVWQLADNYADTSPPLFPQRCRGATRHAAAATSSARAKSRRIINSAHEPALNTKVGHLIQESAAARMSPFGTKQTCQDRLLIVRFRGEADMRRQRVAYRSVAITGHRPARNLAAQRVSGRNRGCAIVWGGSTGAGTAAPHLDSERLPGLIEKTSNVVLVQ